MRRGINIRKRKRISFKEINTKTLKLILLLSFFTLVCLFIYFFFIQNIFIKKNFENDNFKLYTLNTDIPFSLEKIMFFSSATANSESLNQSLINLDLSQYCDIGIYLSNSSDKNAKINSVYIDNISISSPELGIPCLYKKNISDFGKCSFNENDIINNRYNFDMSQNNTNNTNSEKNRNINDFSSNLFTIGFYNKNIKEDFLTDSNEIIYNGTLLKQAAIPITSLNCSISFNLNIITSSDEQYTCNINFDIPFKNSDTSIYDKGYIIKELTSNELSKFIRTK